MGDLISREALLEEIKCYQMDIVSKATAMRVIRNAPAVTDTNVGGKWIPCSERLPTNYDNLLICQSDGYVNVGYYSINEFKDVNSYPYKDVIAWMPLPEPYKGE